MNGWFFVRVGQLVVCSGLRFVLQLKWVCFDVAIYGIVSTAEVM